MHSRGLFVEGCGPATPPPIIPTLLAKTDAQKGNSQKLQMDVLFSCLQSMPMILNEQFPLDEY